jgi:hypothetical protein
MMKMMVVMMIIIITIIIIIIIIIAVNYKYISLWQYESSKKNVNFAVNFFKPRNYSTYHQV